MKQQLAKHLEGGEAFQPITHFLEEIAFEQVGIRPAGLPYSFYELFYHIVFAQKDILDFIISENYKTPNWPKEYWPEKQAPSDEKEWEQLKKKYLNDRQHVIDYMHENDLNAPIQNGNRPTLFREILLVLEHTAYHTGQLAIVGRLLKKE